MILLAERQLESTNTFLFLIILSLNPVKPLLAFCLRHLHEFFLLTSFMADYCTVVSCLNATVSDMPRPVDEREIFCNGW